MFLQKITIITLGVQDLSHSRMFYRRLGFIESSASNDDIAFFKMNGIVFSLFGRAALAHESGLNQMSSPGVFSLAYNTASEAETDAMLAFAVECGATLVKPAEKAFWGGYSGYFADPDGHRWEVPYNPFMPFDTDGNLILP